MKALNSHAAIVIALAPSPTGGWFFAARVGGRVTYGPLAARWDRAPQLRDLDDQHRDLGPVRDVIVAAPPWLDLDDLRVELRRVPALMFVRVHIYEMADSDIAAALGIEGPGGAAELGGVLDVEDVRRALGEHLPGIELAVVENGVVFAVAMTVAGEQAHRRWEGRFGRIAVSGLAPADTTVRTHPTEPRREPTRYPPRPARQAARRHGERSFVTLADIAEILGIDRTTAYRLAERCDIATHRVGRQIRVRREDLDAYLSRQREASSEERALTARGKLVALPSVTAITDDHQRARAAARKLGWDPE